MCLTCAPPLPSVVGGIGSLQSDCETGAQFGTKARHNLFFLCPSAPALGSRVWMIAGRLWRLDQMCDE